MSKTKVFLTNTDETVKQEVKECCGALCYDFNYIDDAGEFWQRFPDLYPTVVILGSGFGYGQDTLEICKKIRAASDVQILFISPKRDPFDIVLALELGADDYIVAPFDAREFSARLKTAVRHAEQLSRLNESDDESEESPAVSAKLTYPGLKIDHSKYSVIVDGHNVIMPPKEFELLYCLASNPGVVFTREQLLNHVWGFDFVGNTRTVDVHIKRMRDKICGNDHVWSVTTIWGKGYRFDVKKS
ncbi:MAG: response regulator transcription factor [Clostridia bacterium]|nr:response regulator transcription factor [Clostridia bacterium]